MGIFRRRRGSEPITDPVTGEVYAAEDLKGIGADVMRAWLHGDGFTEDEAQRVRDRLARDS